MTTGNTDCIMRAGASLLLLAPAFFIGLPLVAAPFITHGLAAIGVVMLETSMAQYCSLCSIAGIKNCGNC